MQPIAASPNLTSITPYYYIYTQLSIFVSWDLLCAKNKLAKYTCRNTLIVLRQTQNESFALILILIGIGIFYNNAHPQQYFRDRRTKTEKDIQFITFLLWFLQYTKRSFLTVHIGTNTITLQVGWLSQSTCTNTYLHVYFESPPNGLNFLQCTRFLLSRNVCSCRMF